MSIIAGDIVQIREERHSADGVVVSIEQGTDYDGTETDFVIADFGGPTPGCIPMRQFDLPTHNIVKPA